MIDGVGSAFGSGERRSWVALDPATSPVSGENLVVVSTASRSTRHGLRPVLDMTGVPDDDLEDPVPAAGEAAARAVEHVHLAGTMITFGSHGTTVVPCDPAGSSR